MTLAILSAVTCLASRGLGRRKLQRLLGDYAVDPDKADTYAPEMTVFFYFLSALKAAPFIERLRTADQAFVVRALSSDIIDFAPYVVAKHRWVNRAFIMTGMTLGFFLCAGVSYVIRVHLAVLPPSPRPHGIGAHRFKAVIQAQSARCQSSNDRRLKLRS